MTATKKMLAFDLGAESGRGLVAAFNGERLELEVVHRFPNGPVQTLDALHWDVLRLWGEMLDALRRAGSQHGDLASVGVDTWRGLCPPGTQWDAPGQPTPLPRP